MKKLYDIKYSVALNPNISSKTRGYIEDNIEPSMEDVNELSFLYPIPDIMKHKESISKKDVEVFKKLEAENIGYVEF